MPSWCSKHGRPIRLETSESFPQSLFALSWFIVKRERWYLSSRISRTPELLTYLYKSVRRRQKIHLCVPRMAKQDAGHQMNFPVARRLSGVCAECLPSGERCLDRDTCLCFAEKFQRACRIGHLLCVRVMLTNGANPNDHIRGEPLIVSAAAKGQTDLVRLLAEAGADVNSPSSLGITPLTAATCFGHDETIKILVQVGALVNGLGTHGSTALMAAAMMGQTESMGVLISLGADINARDDRSNSVLVEAACGDNHRIVQMLLECGAFINIQNAGGVNALESHLAHHEVNPSKDLAMLLLAAGESLNGSTFVYEDSRGQVRNVDVPSFLLHKELRTCLKHLCREAVRNHLIQLDTQVHLFYQIPHLGLPSLLQVYLRYGIDLNPNTSWPNGRCCRRLNVDEICFCGHRASRE